MPGSCWDPITVRARLPLSQLFCKEKYDIITTRPRRNEQHFADDIFKHIFFNENVWISITISLKFVPMGLINDIPALVQIMVWRRLGDRPFSETLMVKLLTYICITPPQRDKALSLKSPDKWQMWCVYMLSNLYSKPDQIKKTLTFLISSCSCCLCPNHWSQHLSRDEHVVGAALTGDAPTTSGSWTI